MIPTPQSIHDGHPRPAVQIEQLACGSFALVVQDRRIGRFPSATEAAIAGGLRSEPVPTFFCENLNQEFPL